MAKLTGPRVSYHGGPVLRAPTAYAIFWRPRGYTFEPGAGGGDARYERLVVRYLRDVGGTPYYGTLAEYSYATEYGRRAPVAGGPILNRSPFGGARVEMAPYPWDLPHRSPIDRDAVVAQLLRAARWTPPAGSIVFVFTAAGVQRSRACGFHAYYGQGARTVVYAFVTDLWSLAGCREGLRASGVVRSPNGDPFADAAISAAAHEQFEAVTDPLGTAWHTAGADYAEVVDFCPTPGQLARDGHNVVLHGHPYLVQEVWSEAAGRCVLAAPRHPSTAPTPTPTAAATTATATTAPTTSPPTPQPGMVLYTADWSGGLAGWTSLPSSGWTAHGDALSNDGTHAINGVNDTYLTLTAPYQPRSLADYVVEAEIAVVRGASPYQYDFGIGVHSGPAGAYRAGVSYPCNGECEAASFSPLAIIVAGRIDAINGLPPPPVLAQHKFDPGTAFHTYRLEVKGAAIAFLIDGQPVLQATDSRFPGGGEVGLWSNATQIVVRGFKVVAL